jgi:Putative stress-induced transcription regulator/CGNR zinc finger
MSSAAAAADARPEPAPGEELSAALALVNTRLLAGGEPVDLIASAPRAGAWLTGRGLFPAGSGFGDGDAARLRALREVIRTLFAARGAGDVPAAEAVAAFNQALALTPVVAVLSWDEAGARRDQVPLAPAPDAVGVALTRLAADALTVLTSGDGRLPAPCGAHGCIRWFLRTHASRQWCSDRCGDRVRAARHYARRHPAAEA